MTQLDWIDVHIARSNKRYAERQRQEFLLPRTFTVQFDDSKDVPYRAARVEVAEGTLFSDRSVYLHTNAIRDVRGRIMRNFPTMRDMVDCLRARGKVSMQWDDEIGTER